MTLEDSHYIAKNIINLFAWAILVRNGINFVKCDRSENMTIREIKPNSREDTCKNCPELDVNFNSDESYCTLADGEEVRLKRGQHRPEWCPKRAWKN